MLLPAKMRSAASALHLMIDLNAVPPPGIEGIELTDKAVTRDGILCYGAIGVGDTKMKIHRASIAQLFESNTQVLDAEDDRAHANHQGHCAASRAASSNEMGNVI